MFNSNFILDFIFEIFTSPSKSSNKEQSWKIVFFGRIYSELNIKCQPIAINSGTVWPKKGSLIKNKTITISILEAIEPGLDSKEFTNLIEKKIYSELDTID